MILSFIHTSRVIIWFTNDNGLVYVGKPIVLAIPAFNGHEMHKYVIIEVPLKYRGATMHKLRAFIEEEIPRLHTYSALYTCVV